MLALLRERLRKAIESGDFSVRVVPLTSPINRSPKRTFEMILIVEDEIIGWVGCWKRNDFLANGASAPRIWSNNASVNVYPGAGMGGGFSIEFPSPEKAEHFANLLQSAFDQAFESIDIGEVKLNRMMTRIHPN